MTKEEILAKLAELNTIAETRSLTTEEFENVTDLESQLQAAKATEEFRARHQAYVTPANHIGVHVATPKADDTLDRAFQAYLRTGRSNADLTELRAQGEGSPTEGGHLVPDGFRQKLVDRMVAFGGIGNVVETIVTDTGNPLPWPTVDDTGNLGEIVAEGNTFSSGADLTFGTASLGAYTYTAGGGSNLPLRVSVELLQDAAFDIESLVANKLGERVARLQSAHLVTGNGSSQPKGIVHGLTGVEIAADGAGITYDDLVTWIHSVDPSYRNGARWAFNDATLARIKKIKDSHGDPIWRPFDADMSTDTGGGVLMGFPVTIDQQFPDVSLASNTVNFGVFGNLSEGYVRRVVRDITLVVDPITRMASNRQYQYSVFARMDATQQNTHAYVALTGEQ